jgi:hypothetical protein
MVEALVAFVLAVLVLAVFHGPAWSITLGTFGGLAFAFYVLILVIEWIVGRLKVP